MENLKIITIALIGENKVGKSTWLDRLNNKDFNLEYRQDENRLRTFKFHNLKLDKNIHLEITEYTPMDF